MKPAAFDYYAPRSIEETLQLLHGFAREDRNVKLLAGGQSLIPLMNIRLAEPDVIVDINRLEAELGYVRVDERHVRIGALTRHHVTERDPLVLAHAPLLAEATTKIGHAAILSRGTIGGSLVHADPSAELPLAAITLGATLRLRSRDGERAIEARDFFISSLTTDVGADEVLVEVAFPLMPARSGQAIEEFARRHGDFAIVAAAAQIALAPDGSLDGARLGVGGASPVPLDCSAAFEASIGSIPDAADLRRVAQHVSTIVDPDSDIHAGAEYRRELAAEMTLRACRRALERARARLVD
ncbi:MAG TPA: FAD binding domain-containing protein [Candidatus Acidoferrum sp.]|nr:FAD binding domain-containing protein [Candidatus Acidoferrum sp.]